MPTSTTTLHRTGSARLAPPLPRRPSQNALHLPFEPARVPSLLGEVRVEHAVAMAALLANEAPDLLSQNLHALPVEAAAQAPELLADLLHSGVRATDHPSHWHDHRHARRPWTGPFTVLVQDLLHHQVSAGVIATLAPVWPVLLSYRCPAQREELTFHLARDVLAPRAWRIHGPAVRALLVEYAGKRLHKNALLAKLAVLAYADERVLASPGVRRFLEHRRSCRDGRRLRTVINFILATDKLDKREAGRLLHQVLAHGSATAHGVGRSARDVQRAYSQEAVPQVLELCTLYAAYLRLGLPLRAIRPAQRAEEAPLRDAIAHVLLGPQDAALEPNLRALLDTWRAPQRLFIFAALLRVMKDGGDATALLQRVLRVMADGTYERERALHGALDGLAATEREAWTAGAKQPLAALSLPEAVLDGLPAGWNVEDGCSVEDFINSGCDVHGSCQTVDGDPTLSQTLLGRMLDGRRRLLMIKNETGEMVARAMFRLLTSERGRTVALLSKPYLGSTITPLQARKILVGFARQRACALRVPLVGPQGAYGSSLPWSSDLTSEATLGLDYWDELNEDEAASREAVTLPASGLRTLLPRGLWD